MDIRVLIDYKDTVSVINWVYSGIIDKMNGYCTVQNFWRNYTKAKSLGTKSLYVCCANIWEIVNDCVHCTLCISFELYIFWHKIQIVPICSQPDISNLDYLIWEKL